MIEVKRDFTPYILSVSDKEDYDKLETVLMSYIDKNMDYRFWVGKPRQKEAEMYDWVRCLLNKLNPAYYPFP